MSAVVATNQPTPGPSDAQAAPQPSQPSQKSMSKAERRDLQERQRAAKLAQKQQLGGPSQPSLNKGKQPPTTPKKPQSQDAPTRPKEGTVTPAKAQAAVALEDSSNGQKSRGLRIFSHFGVPKALGTGVKGESEIHPAILRLGLLFSQFKICGANARCIASLSAFKTVIQDYSTPPNNTLSRHLMTHISPQITYLVSARPMSVTMGNAIRQLKLEISGSDIDLPEQDAKDALCQKIDNYIRDRIIMADEVIQDLAGQKIKDGDVILTFARSSLVQKILLSAHAEGKQFSVIVVDSRPLNEGKTLLKALTSVQPPIPCTYTLLSAIPAVISQASTVFLGAHSLHANGAVYSRAGTALVAMMAKAHGIPVLVSCETYKYSETVMLDGFGKNELAPPTFSSSHPQPNQALEILNPLYDVTPPNSITAVVTEVGMIPPNSIGSIPLALGVVTL
ncbi:eukaryotic translation initiation factor 2B delta subunit [Cylindrobasidium torrendii FP15055 ss-10]|uniref:Translation initiation factor eIF2B subunit delta n=1 Tax=Cylindrobasidium torrendii FP15055 ss-10 TaxID=1314674 RepID=A0A0D7BTD7_9AGAR|nr:eukaryotic translation initiation factor 2B delta subunit [Cylindrobasidium torrendii FP15055 ss-10]